MKVFLRIPTMGQVDVQLFRWALWLARARPDVDIDTTDPQSFGAADARNTIVRDFLKSDATHLWMLDDDVIPPRRLSILDWPEEPVVAGVYKGISKKGIVWHVYTCLGHDNVKGCFRYAALPRKTWPGKPFFANAAGTGCMVVRRDVLEKMGPWPFYHSRHLDGTIGTEDFNFCHDAAPGGVLILPDYVCAHARVVNVTAFPDGLAPA